jgi:hypothetical protein
MLNRLRRKKAFAIMEYFVLFVILMTAFLTFKDYILRGMAGKWKSAADQFGHGRQYHPTDSVECAYESFFNPVANTYSGTWYDVTCVENKGCPPGNDSCHQQAIGQCHNSFCDANVNYDIN